MSATNNYSVIPTVILNRLLKNMDILVNAAKANEANAYITEVQTCELLGITKKHWPIISTFPRYHLTITRWVSITTSFLTRKK